MKPQEPLAVPPAQNNAPAEAPLAEPPKNIEFTAAPVDDGVHVEQPPELPKQPSGNEEVKAEPGTKPDADKKAKSPKLGGPELPIVGVAVAVLIFAALAVVAYLAYTKS